ncbi:MAG TPA: Crp/Fnr family transcriptional regulator [Cyclobacteriaceae bacterium]|jgi:CRP-like cAMP-binding protein|nr:Crp/Fnr family transcriptional regulator [Cyclobacteriaceae bacterium]
MDSAELIKVIKSIHPVSENFTRTLKGMLIPLSFPKNHLLLKPPAICEHIYFIHRGFAMCYLICKKKRNVESFWKEGQFVLSASSFFEQKPTEQYIQLMRKSDLLAVTHASFQRLYVLYPETQQLFQLITIHDNQRARRHVFEIKHMEAYERFEKLIKIFPDIDKAVPQECIASYLGITPQSFSRMKKLRMDS